MRAGYQIAIEERMPASGHSRPSHLAPKSTDVCYAPKATVQGTSPINATCQKRTSLATIAASGICLIPIHSLPIFAQAIEKVHILSLRRNRAYSDAGIRDSAEHHARRPNGNSLMGTLMGTLWERAQCSI